MKQIKSFGTLVFTAVLSLGVTVMATILLIAFLTE